MEFNLNTPFNSYLIGILQTDGSHYETTRNRGKITLEVSKRDADIITKINNNLIQHSSISTRIRDTNFKKDYESITLGIFDLEFRTETKKYLPVGKKSDIITMPNNVIKSDYWRGIVDGDGSLGITKNNLPFISFATASEILANQFLAYIKEIVGVEKTAVRNKRDNIYNIMLTNENAQILVEELYYENCFGIDRKINKSKEVLGWIRPENIKKREYVKKNWTKDEDEFIILNPLEVSMEQLDRTQKSVEMRLYRLKMFM